MPDTGHLKHPVDLCSPGGDTDTTHIYIIVVHIVATALDGNETGRLIAHKNGIVDGFCGIKRDVLHGELRRLKEAAADFICDNDRSKSGFLQCVGKSDGSGWSVCLGMAGDIKAGGQKNTAFWQGQQLSGRAQTVMLVQIRAQKIHPAHGVPQDDIFDRGFSVRFFRKTGLGTGHGGSS